MNNVPAKPLGDDVWTIVLDKVKASDTITLSISLDAKDAAQYESFVILNHNPQKP